MLVASRRIVQKAIKYRAANRKMERTARPVA